VLGVAPAGDNPPHPDEERRQLRPYRLFLVVMLAIAIIGLCGMILRGIINTLDRLPSAETMQRLEVVDVRALRACSEDLGRLEARTRRDAARALSEQDAISWNTLQHSLEVERLTIVARCRLDEPQGDPAVLELARASTAMENLLRSYTLFFERLHKEGGAARDELHDALQAVQPLLEPN